MELGTALQLVVAVAMPFVLYILHGIRQSVHELRNQMQPVVTDVAVLKADMKTTKRQLHLMDETS